MMNKAKSSTMTLAKYFLTVPLLFLFVMGNSVFAARNEDKTVAIRFADESPQAVSQPEIADVNLPEPPPEKTADEIFVVVENQPEFPRGTEAMMKHLADNMRYPVIAQENGIQGRVVCGFVIKKDGSIGDVKVLRGADPSLDAEVVRIIESMPKWKPGTQRGEAVDVRAIFPAVFRLQGDTPQDELLTEAERQELFGKHDDPKNLPDGIMTFDEVVVIGYGTQQPIGQESAEAPLFPGGEEALMKYLSDNIKYPVIASENGIQGLVSAVYNIDTKGKVTFVRFAKSVDPSLDKEVKRVIENMPDWTPGKINGEVTSTTSEANFVFRLQGEGIESYSGPTPENAIVVVGYGLQKKD